MTPWTKADFLHGAQALLPHGPAWPRRLSAVLTKLLQALVPIYAYTAERALELIAEAFPATATNLLPEWEAALGLPDPCAGPDQTVAQRQAHVVARLTEQDGPSIPSLTAFASTLGFPITIEEFAPARAGRLRAGQRCYGRDWAFAWRVHAPAISVTYFRAGRSRAGEPLQAYGNLALVCELQRLAPAHTKPLFAFGS